MTQRDDEWKRVSAMAGLDEEDGILPPDASGGIDRSTPIFWHTLRYGAHARSRLEAMGPITPPSTPLMDMLQRKAKH